MIYPNVIDRLSRIGLTKVFVILIAVFLGTVIIMGLETLADNHNMASSSDEVVLAPGVDRFIDEEAAVACWVYKSYNRGGIFCIPVDQTDLSY